MCGERLWDVHRGLKTGGTEFLVVEFKGKIHRERDHGKKKKRVVPDLWRP